MAIIEDRVNVAASTTVRNVLQGETFEFTRAPSGLRGGVVVEFGTPAGTGRFNFQVGAAETVRNALANIETALGAGVDTNRDLKIVEAMRQGERLILDLINNDVAARDFQFYFVIS